MSAPGRNRAYDTRFSPKSLAPSDAPEALARSRVTVTGRLIADPELRHTAAGVPITKLQLATQGTDDTIVLRVFASQGRDPFREGGVMRDVVALPPLHKALAELELAAALVLLAEQEDASIAAKLPRLRSALGAVHRSRELAVEPAESTGRPSPSVLDGGLVVAPTVAPGAA